LMQGTDFEVVEHEAKQVMGPFGPMLVHDVEIERVKPRNTCIIENVPPENVRVDKNARGLSLQDPRTAFVQHIEMKTISELRDEGFDVDDDISDSGDAEDSYESLSRDKYTPDFETEDNGNDPSMRRVRVRETWIRCDFDGDGRSELRHVIAVGTTVLSNEDCDSVSLVALCPIPLAHRHIGLSVADAVMDLQKIQTALLRGALDNQYLANNGRYAVSDDVNLDDMLDSRAGGVVRVTNGAQPGNSILPLTHPTNGSIAIPMMEYVDNLAQRRTGVNERSQGIDSTALNNNAGVAANNSMISASQQRIKFIARIFAETGIKRLFQLVHEITLKNSRQEQIVELRGEWVPVNPRTWTKRTDMVISVALGAGDRPQQLAFLAQQRMMQMELVPTGLATPTNVYNTLKRMSKAAGYKDPDEFWTDPVKNPPQPQQPPPDPRIVVAQMQNQSDVQKFQAETQMTREIEQIKAEAKQRETQLQLELQASNDARDAERQSEKIASDAYLAKLKLESDERLAMLQADIDKYKADLDSQTKLTIAGMSAENSLTLARESTQAAVDTSTVGAVDGAKENIVKSVDNVLSKIAEPVNQLAQMHGQSMANMERLMQQIAKPKKLVRGPDGKATGVE